LNYDVTNVVAMFLKDESESRRKLMDQLRIELQAHERPTLELLASITEKCMKTPGVTPALTVEIAAWYGMGIGIRLEQDRLLRAERELIH
jgi:hypothetical protein